MDLQEFWLIFRWFLVFLIAPVCTPLHTLDGHRSWRHMETNKGALSVSIYMKRNNRVFPLFFDLAYKPCAPLGEMTNVSSAPTTLHPAVTDLVYTTVFRPNIDGELTTWWYESLECRPPDLLRTTVCAPLYPCCV